MSLDSAHGALWFDLTHASFLKDVELWEFSRNLVRQKFQVWRVGRIALGLFTGRSEFASLLLELFMTEVLALRLKLISFTAASRRTVVTVSLYNTVIKLSLR